MSGQVPLRLINTVPKLSVLQVQINKDWMRVIAFTLKHTHIPIKPSFQTDTWHFESMCWVHQQLNVNIQMESLIIWDNF